MVYSTQNRIERRGGIGITSNFRNDDYPFDMKYIRDVPLISYLRDAKQTKRAPGSGA